MLAVLAGTGAGVAVGWLCGQVPVRPITQAMAAAILGWVSGSVGVVAFTLLTLRLPASGGLGAVSVGLSEAGALGIAAILLLAVAGWFALPRLGWGNVDALGTYATGLLGGAAALIAALWVARALVVSI